MHYLGIALQLVALVFLPVLMIWQLNLGLPLLVMPLGLLGAMFVFHLGSKLRESNG